MGLGPSIKMTTKHHFYCPATEVLSADPEIDFDGILVDGVSENCDDKLRTALHTAQMAKARGWDGALVAIDGWGNHHVDFMAVMENLREQNIRCVGLSYIGLQGRPVCPNVYGDVIIDFNKSVSGYESCVVGQNNLDAMDAWKALGILKYQCRGIPHLEKKREPEKEGKRQLKRTFFSVGKITFAQETAIFPAGNGDNTVLTIHEKWKSMADPTPRIKKAAVEILRPGERDCRVNSNLDFMPVACKERGRLGEGITDVLSGLTLMLTGAECTGYQPANIGSSEGILQKQVEFGAAGTPADGDWLLHMDITFAQGEGRTAQGIADAHFLLDTLAQEIREAIRRDRAHLRIVREEVFDEAERAGAGRPRIGLVKIVSGLGAMYDTVLFPKEPCGIQGGFQMRERGNEPVYLTANACRDGAIHSLL